MESLVIQGRNLDQLDLDWIRDVIWSNPGWHRSRISLALCERWQWRNAVGQYKDMAARTLLLKLERRGLIQLPPRQRVQENRKPVEPLDGLPLQFDAPATLSGSLKGLGPLAIELVESSQQRSLFRDLLRQYHYLSYHRPVGENLQYLASDGQGRPVACLLFGAAAWKCAPRDQWIGWTAQQREQGLPGIANNMRFLILPWVRIPNLASWLLSQTGYRISQDWLNKYGHKIWLLETFVDQQRFTGACYRAANWLCLGQTQGRSRNDRKHENAQPIRWIYGYPLHQKFRHRLKGEPT
jgi:hypothetical protein